MENFIAEAALLRIDIVDATAEVKLRQGRVCGASLRNVVSRTQATPGTLRRQGAKWHTGPYTMLGNFLRESVLSTQTKTAWHSRMYLSICLSSDFVFVSYA